MSFNRTALLCIALLASAPSWGAHRPQQDWRYASNDNQVFGSTLQHVPNIGPRTGVDSASNLFVASTRYASATPCMVVVKLGSEDGKAIWRRDLCGGPGEALAVDAAGDVIAVGIQSNLAFVTKLSGSDGRTIWSITPPSMGSAVTVRLDGNGNPIVAGLDGDTIVVTKLANATGAAAWTTRESAPGVASFGSATGFTAFTVNAAGASAYSYSLVDAQQNVQRFTTSLDAGGTRRWTVPAGPVQLLFSNGDAFDSQRRLAAADGAALWTAPNTLARATLDAGENVVGVQVVNAAGGNYHVAMRLASATGAVAWSRSLQQANVAQSAPDLTVSLGTFIITNSPTIGFNGQSRTGLQIVELDAFSGALLFNTIDADPTTRVTTSELAVGSRAYLTGLYGSSQAPEVGSVAYAMSDTRHAMDFNADGQADLAWRHQGDNVHGFWLMNGQAAGAAGAVSGPPGALVVQIADFDGDGKSDLLWRGPRGEYSITLMDGLTAKSTMQILGAGTGWEVVAKADFDHDGRADLLWKHPSQGYGVWLMNGTTAAGVGAIPTPGPGFDFKLTGDFNHDGRTDIVWTHPDGRAAITLMSGLNANNITTVIGPSTGWSPVATGDFNGDGKSDLVWKHADGSYGLWLLDGTRVTYAAGIRGPRTGWTLALVRDFNRDGSTDMLWTNAAGAYEGWLMASDVVLQSKTLYTGGSWAVAGSGDFDGDGKDDLLWRSTSGDFGTWLMDGLEVRSAASVLPGGSGWEIAP